MQADGLVGLRGLDRRLVRRDRLPTFSELRLVDDAELTCQVDIGGVVSRLAGEQAAVHLGEFGLGSGRVEEASELIHAIARSRLDERATQQRIQDLHRLVRPTDLEQACGVAAGDLALEFVTAPSNLTEDLLEVSELFAGQAGQRDGQKRVIRIPKDQTQRRRCRLLFAVCVIDQYVVEVGHGLFGPARWRGCGEVEHGRSVASLSRSCETTLVPGCARGSSIWRLGPAAALTGLAVCATPALPLPVMTIASPGRVTQTPPRVATIVAAQVSALGDEDPDEDAIWLVFSKDLDAVSVSPDRFQVVLGGGRRATPTSARFGPADEADENRSLILRGAFRVDGELRPQYVQVTGPVHAEDGTALRGVELAVAGAEEPDRMVLAIVGNECGTGRNTIQTFWSDALAGVDDDDLARVAVIDATGARQPVLAFADHAGGAGRMSGAPGGDSDDNVLALCVAADVRAVEVIVESAAFTDRAGRATAASVIRVEDRL